MKMSMTKITILILRIVFGLMFLISGFEKLTSGFTASSYLLKVSTGPFATMFGTFAGNVMIDQLVIWGEIGIGLALLLGILIRFASFWGIIMMLLYYISVLPPQTGWINQHIIFICVFIVLAGSGSGRNFGLDKLIERKKFSIKNIKILRYLLG